jgi:predicted dehydrogenase
MVKVALLGAGFMGTMHSECYANIPRARVVAVADIRPDKLAAQANKHGARAFKTADEAIAESGAEMVDICLPTYMHCEYTVKAAKAGLHIVCEKPMSHKLAEAKKMVTAVRKAGIKFMCAHVIRFWPEYILLKEYVAKKKLGKLLALSLHRVSPKPTWTWGNWIVKGELSGGALADLHVHDADFVRYLCGEPSGVDTVATKHKVSGLDYVFTNYYYRNLAVCAEGAWNLPSSFGFFMAYRAVFEKGSLEFDMRLKPSITLCTADGKVEHPEAPQPQGVGGAAAGGNISSLGGYYNELKYFVECVEKRKEPKMATVEDSCKTVALLEAEVKSAEKKLK